MIEATCAACGTLNRIAEGDVPVGAKFVTCSSCKSRVPIATKSGVAPALAIPSVRPPTAPSQQTALPPRPPTAPTTGLGGVPAGGQRGDVIDLADLPAPKRANSLGDIASKPAPRSGLSAASADPDLPAPKAKPMPSGPLDLDDLLAPTTPPARPPSSPAATSTRGSVPDLPAPKPRAPAISDLPAPKSRQTPPLDSPLRPPAPIADLPAPKPRAAAIADLPAPKRAGSVPDLPAPKGPPAVSDLPAPKRAPAGIIDLPAPKPGGGGGFSDLPMPKAAAPRARAEAFDGGLDLDDLPAPAADLPAPKGFFDDLPQPAFSQAAASKPGDDIAPKGFFDDLPQVKSTAGTQRGASDLPAPKGFFDDLPQPAFSQAAASKPGDDIAPKGFFDDLPGPTSTPVGPPAPPLAARATAKPTTVAPPTSNSGLFGDIGLPTAGADPTQGGLSLDDGPELDLSLGPSKPAAATVAALAANAPAPSAQRYDDLELGAAAPGGIRFDAARPGGREPTGQLPTGSMSLLKRGDQTPSPLSLELEDSQASAKLQPKRTQTQKPIADPAVRRRRMRMIGAAVIAVAALGGGGAFMYMRHAASAERADQVTEQLTRARAALVAGDPTHWQHAVTAAKKALEIDPTNPDALGIGAEASFAGALDDGINPMPRFAAGRKMLKDATEAGVTGPAIERAQALAPLVGGQGAHAVDKLKALAMRAPKDPTLALYLGWAELAAGDPTAAVAALEPAVAATSVKVPALYARGRAKLALGDLPGARTDFAAVLEVVKDHIGAQVGLAAAESATQASQQEADLLAILSRKDIDKADPRAVVQAWVLAGEAAKRAGRLDAARARYHKALAIAADDIGAIGGLADVELRDNKLDTAADLAAKALTVAPDSVTAQLISGEVAVKQNKLDDANAKIAALAARKPPLGPRDQVRLALLTGHLLEAKQQPDAAVDAYLAGAKAAGDGNPDLTLPMSAVNLLTTMSKAAAEAKDPARAAQYHDHADQILGDLASAADKDAGAALTLGVAYLQVKDAAKAEPWLVKATAGRPNDAEALFQLAKAQSLLGKTDEAMATLSKVIAIDPGRADVGLELARTYEAANRNDDADKLYTKLLSVADPSLELRARAGRYWARTGEMAKAAEQGQAIIAVDPDNAAGQYLTGESLLAAGKSDEAMHAFQQASDADHDAQYLDGLGRAAETRSLRTGDTRFQDVALRAYADAHAADPKMYNPVAGTGRLYVARGELEKASPSLQAAWAMDGTDPEIALDLGIAAQAFKQLPVAAAWYQKSNNLKPTADASYRLASVLDEQNQPAQAVSAYLGATQIALEQEKKTGEQVKWLSDALYRLGRLQQQTNPTGTRSAWEKFLARPQTNADQVDEIKRWLKNNP